MPICREPAHCSTHFLNSRLRRNTGSSNWTAVIDALASGHLAGAGIDVLEHEPPPENSPVLQAWRDPAHPAHDRLLLNPHVASYCEEGEKEFPHQGRPRSPPCPDGANLSATKSTSLPSHRITIQASRAANGLT